MKSPLAQALMIVAKAIEEAAQQQPEWTAENDRAVFYSLWDLVVDRALTRDVLNEDAAPPEGGF